MTKEIRQEFERNLGRLITDDEFSFLVMRDIIGDDSRLRFYYKKEDFADDFQIYFGG